MFTGHSGRGDFSQQLFIEGGRSLVFGILRFGLLLDGFLFFSRTAEIFASSSFPFKIRDAV